jgi:hypothetical protein
VYALSLDLMVPLGLTVKSTNLEVVEDEVDLVSRRDLVRDSMQTSYSVRRKLLAFSLLNQTDPEHRLGNRE